jgi:hypothetical protein
MTESYPKKPSVSEPSTSRSPTEPLHTGPQPEYRQRIRAPLRTPRMEPRRPRLPRRVTAPATPRHHIHPRMAARDQLIVRRVHRRNEPPPRPVRHGCPRCAATSSPNARNAVTAATPWPSLATLASRNARARTSGSSGGNSTSTAATSPATSSTVATRSRRSHPGRHSAWSPAACARFLRARTAAESATPLMVSRDACPARGQKSARLAGGEGLSVRSAICQFVPGSRLARRGRIRGRRCRGRGWCGFGGGFASRRCRWRGSRVRLPIGGSISWSLDAAGALVVELGESGFVFGVEVARELVCVGRGFVCVW